MNQQLRTEVVETPSSAYGTVGQTQTSLRCFDFDGHQLDLQYCVLPGSYEIDGSGLCQDNGPHINAKRRHAPTTINLFMCTEIEPLAHLLDPDQISIVIVTAGRIDPAYLHAAAFEGSVSLRSAIGHETLTAPEAGMTTVRPAVLSAFNS